MAKPIELTTAEWRIVLEQLHEDYGMGVLAIRDRMRKRLGFTHRTHRRKGLDGWWEETVYLDFFEEQKRTMFLLKYANLINGEKVDL